MIDRDAVRIGGDQLVTIHLDMGGLTLEEYSAQLGHGRTLLAVGWGGPEPLDRIAGIRTHDYLKARLLYVRQDFDEVLDELTDEHLPWRPTDDLPSVAGLLVEMANKEKELIAWLQRGEWPDDDPDAFEETATLEEMRLVFAALRQQTLRYIDSFDEAGLEELVPSPEKWWEALRLEACPRSEILRNLASHEWYHTGQLIVYLHVREHL